MKSPVHETRVTPARWEKLEPRLTPLPLPARSLLPTPPTPLFGRAQEVQAICALLQRQDVRMLTLTGTAGVGKTRLALEAAADIDAAFPDGVVFIPLAALADPAFVLPTISRALLLHDTGAQPILTLLTSALRDQQALLVLDNFEQVIGAAPSLAALLEACPLVKLLVTSREVLHLRAEHQVVVSPLPLPALPPEETLGPRDPATLAENPAMQLFLHRVRAVQPDFQMTPDTAVTLARICQHLEGIPLALELAAPRLKLLSPQALLTRLEGRLQVLTGGAADLPERQRTMRAAITWSYELLAPAEQALLRRLAVCVGGWSLAAAEQICQAAGALELDLLDGLTSLLDKSLLRKEPGSDREPRFGMLSVLREFGRERLEAAGELAATRAAHAACYLALAEEAEPQLVDADQTVWLDRLEQDHDNLRAALTWWLEQAEQAGDQAAAVRALRLCGALRDFWLFRFYLREGSAFLERALAVQAGVPETVQLHALLKTADLPLVEHKAERSEAPALARPAGTLQESAEELRMRGQAAFLREQFVSARADLEEAATRYQQAGDARKNAWCLRVLIPMLLMMGEYEQAVMYGEEALATSRARGNQLDVGVSLSNLGHTLFLSGRDQPRGTALAAQGLSLLREEQAGVFTSFALYRLGMIRRSQARFDEARRLLEEALALAEDTFGPLDRFRVQTELARVLVQQGEVIEARARYEAHRVLLPTSGGKWLIAYYLEGRAVLEVALGARGVAVRLWGAAEALREALGAPLFPVERAEYAPIMAAVRTHLGEAAFAAAWAEGRSMPLEQVVATAKEESLPRLPDEPAT